MRILSPLLTIAVGQANSNGIDVGNAIICGVVVLTVGSETADLKLQHMVGGNLGQGNEVWTDLNILDDDGTSANIVKVNDAALAASKTYLFNVTKAGLPLPVLRLATTANIATTALTAKLILQPRG